MIPKLLVGGNRDEEIQKYLETQIKQFAISPFDFLVLGENNSAIKIEQIRELKQKVSLKPRSGTKKATIIYNAQNLTAEAQNALLKTLEEPPEDTVVLLCCPNENLLLPTIMSRCEIIRLNSKSQILNSKQIQKNIITLQQILQFDTGEKFAFAEKLTKKIDKDEKLEDIRKRVEDWLTEIIAELHRGLLANVSPDQNAKNLKTLLAAQKQLRQNLNVRLVLENCFLELYNK